MIRRLLTSLLPLALVVGMLPGTARAAANPPNQPQRVLFSFTQSTGTLTWLPPEPVDGGEPIVGYDVFLRVDGHAREIHRVEGTTFSFPMGPGKHAHGSVRAVTQSTAGPSDGGGWVGTASVGLVMALDTGHHATYKLADQGDWHALGGPVLAAAPTVARFVGGRVVFIGADPDGRLWGRSLSQGWRVLSDFRCSSPSAGVLAGGRGLSLGCVSAGRLFYGYAAGASGDVPTDLGFTATHYREVAAGDLRSLLGGLSTSLCSCTR